jgi:hypothetical protein
MVTFLICCLFCFILLKRIEKLEERARSFRNLHSRLKYLEDANSDYCEVFPEDEPCPRCAGETELSYVCPACLREEQFEL